MTDSVAASKAKIFVGTLILFAVFVAAFFFSQSSHRISINSDINTVIPESKVVNSVTVGELTRTSSIKTALLRHWPLSIAISLFLLVSFILGTALLFVVEHRAGVAETEIDPENNTSVDEPRAAQARSVNLKKTLAVIWLVASVVAMVVVVFESIQAVRAKENLEDDQDPNRSDTNHMNYYGSNASNQRLNHLHQRFNANHVNYGNNFGSQGPYHPTLGFNAHFNRHRLGFDPHRPHDHPNNRVQQEMWQQQLLRNQQFHNNMQNPIMF